LARTTRKKTKFNLDEDGDEGNFDFLTHKGKKIEDIDDFKDRISNDSDAEYYEDRDM